MTILGRGDLSPRRRPHRRGPLLATILVGAVLAAAAWFGWHAIRGGGGHGAKVAVPTCVTPSAAPTPAEPAQVTVAVLNSTDKVGMAHQVAAALRTRGFRIGKVGNTKPAVSGVATVTFGPGGRPGALAVAEQVPGAQLASASAGGVTIVLGPRFTTLASAADASAAHARDVASASPRPAVCTTP